EADALISLDQYRSDPRFGGTDGHGYAIAVLDTGIDLSNPDFGPDDNGDGIADRIVYAYDFVSSQPYALDRNGHGTNVASIAAGNDGVAPGANIIALQVLQDNGAGSFSTIDKGLQWVGANAVA